VKVGGAFALSLALAVAGCAPTYAAGYEDALAAGLRAQNAGRWDEAQASFAKAADLGDRYKDRDEARLLQAEAFERLERWDEAESTYRRIEREAGGRYQGVRAAFALGRLVRERRGFEVGSLETLAAVRKYPSSGLVRHAVKRLLDEVESEKGPEAAMAWLEPVRARLHGTEAEEAIEYEHGKLLARCGRKEEAIASLLAQARKFAYPAGSLTDDAYYVASLFLEDVGRPKEAISVLEEMMAPSEAAYAGASYERPRWPEGAYRIAVLYRDALKDRAKARVEFRRAYDAHRSSRLADDALWQLALLEKEDGDQDAACRSAKTLKEDEPDSRYLRCLSLVCSAMPAADKPCPDYVREGRDVSRAADALYSPRATESPPESAPAPRAEP
jgi:tetratricopeptide (TPR) repeat protein